MAKKIITRKNKKALHLYSPGGALAEAFNKDNIGDTIPSMASSIGGLAGSVISNAQTKDTSSIDGQIAALKSYQVGASDNDALMSEWGSFTPMDNISWRDIKKSGGEQAGNVLGAMGSGATLGSVAGPLGTAIGAVGGLFAGLGGLFAGNRKAKKKARKLNREIDYANASALAKLNEAADRIDTQNDLTAMATYFADGGKIHIKPSKRGTFTAAAKKHGKGVQEFARQVLANKENYSPAMVKKANFARNASKWKHDMGGFLFDNGGNLMGIVPNDTQHGGIFSNGVTFIDEGKTHEENPYGGVPMGIAPDGQPNLVEEGEVKFNNYIFSNRLSPNEDILGLVHLPTSYANNSFALIAEKLSKESEERPNDPISKRGLNDSMTKLQMAQEIIKAQENQDNLFAKGGHLFNKGGGYSYGNNPLNYDRGINAQESYYNNPNYMNSRDYILNNWDSPEVQNWIQTILIPEVEQYNKSRGYNRPFTITRNEYERGSMDNQVGAIHNATRAFTIPNGERNSIITGINPSQYFDGPVFTEDNSPSWLNTAIGMFNETPSTTEDEIEVEDNGNRGLSWLRYAPIVGSGIQAIADLFGANAPDYTNADIVGRSVDNLRTVGYTPINNYLAYRPFDRNYYANRLASQAGATRRALMNTSGGNRAAARAGILAADYDAQDALGQLFRQAEEYNLAQRQQVENFNRGTNMANAEMGLKAGIANQAQDKVRLQGRMAEANLREQADSISSQARSANLTNFLDNLGALGRESIEWNMVNSIPGFRTKISRDGRVRANGGYVTINKKRRK